MSRGNFFAVDRRAWAAVCGLGSINAAVAYLVLARGTLGDMRTTSWSVNAIEARTAIARARAATAIKQLITTGMIEQTKGGKRPTYRIAIEPPHDWIWLPNSIVDAAAGETPSVERIRQTQNLPALRLFVDLYHAQDLAADGGVNWRQLRMQYGRYQVGQQGPFVVWGFWPTTQATWEHSAIVRPFLTGRKEVVKLADGTARRDDTGMPAFWGALAVLTDTGLLDFVGHLVEADNDQASVIHPVAQGNGEDLERHLLYVAHDAGLLLLTPAQAEWAQARSMFLVPVVKHIANVAVVGLPRLRHRAATSATADWLSRTEEWQAWIDRYVGMVEKALPDRQMQYQR